MRWHIWLLLIFIPGFQATQPQAQVRSLEQLSTRESAQEIHRIIKEDVDYNEILKNVNAFLGHPPKPIQEKINTAFFYQHYLEFLKLFSLEPIKIITDRNFCIGELNAQGTLMATTHNGIFEIRRVTNYHVESEPSIAMRIREGTFDQVTFSKSGTIFIAQSISEDLQRSNLFVFEIVYGKKMHFKKIAHIPIGTDEYFTINPQGTLLVILGNNLKVYSIKELKAHPHDYKPIVRPLPKGIFKEIIYPSSFDPTGNVLRFLLETVSTPSQAIFYDWPMPQGNVAQHPIERLRHFTNETPLSFAYNHSNTLFAVANLPNPGKISIWPIVDGVIDTSKSPQEINLPLTPTLDVITDFNADDSMLFISAHSLENENKLHVIGLSIDKGIIDPQPTFNSTIDARMFEINSRISDDIIYLAESQIKTQKKCLFQLIVYANPTPTSFNLDQMIFLSTLYHLWELSSMTGISLDDNTISLIKNNALVLSNHDVFKTFAQPLQMMITNILKKILTKVLPPKKRNRPQRLIEKSKEKVEESTE